MPILKLAEESLRFSAICAGASQVAADHDTGWRTLPCAAIAHVRRGVLLLELPGAQAQRLSEQAYCVPPGLYHRSYSGSPSGFCRWSHVSFRLFEGVDVLSMFELPLLQDRAASEKIGVCNEQLAHILNGPAQSIKDVVRLQALGLELLTTLIETAPVREGALQRVAASQRLLSVTDHIRRNFGRELRLSQLAKVAHLSPSRFHAVFKQVHGLAPRDFIQRLRLQRAQELLIGTELRVCEIADQIGLANVFHFSRLFHKRCGLPPTEYRRRGRSGIV